MSCIHFSSASSILITLDWYLVIREPLKVAGSEHSEVHSAIESASPILIDVCCATQSTISHNGAADSDERIDVDVHARRSNRITCVN